MGEPTTVVGQDSPMLSQHLSPGHARLQQGQLQYPRTVADPLLGCQGPALHCSAVGWSEVAVMWPQGATPGLAELSTALGPWLSATGTGTAPAPSAASSGGGQSGGQVPRPPSASSWMLASIGILSKHQPLWGDTPFSRSRLCWPIVCCWAAAPCLPAMPQCTQAGLTTASWLNQQSPSQHTIVLS